MHAPATNLSPFQRKFNSRRARPEGRPLQQLPVLTTLTTPTVAERQMAQSRAATGLTLLVSAALLTMLPNQLRAQTLGPQMSSSSAMVRVISATPNLERITETRQQCSYETQQVVHAPAAQQAGMSSTGGAVLGALAGGLLASQIGKGNGKHVAIAAGSATGAMIGRNMAEQSNASSGMSTISHQQVQVCRPISVQREQVRDYTVRYEHQGQEYQVLLPQHPGQWLKLNISHTVQPV